MTTPLDIARVQLQKFMIITLHPPYDAAKIFAALAGGIKILATVKALSGAEKKSLLLETLKDAIGGADLPIDLINNLTDLIDGIGDPAIDWLVQFGQDMTTFAKRKCLWCKST